MLGQQGLDGIPRISLSFGGRGQEFCETPLPQPLESLHCWAGAGSLPGSHRVKLSIGSRPQVGGR